MPAQPFTPHYRRIMNDIREQIADGRLAPGAKLPSTQELAERYEVRPSTVRQAITLLTEAGDVRGHQGLGVFVAEPTADPPISGG